MLPVQWCSICESPIAEAIALARRVGTPGNILASRFEMPRHTMWRHLEHIGMPFRRYVSGYCLEFLILTAVRRKQAASINWAHIDWEDKVWVCPNHKTKKKTRQDYVVPLSNAAMAVLDSMKERQEAAGVFHENGFVFLGDKGRCLSPQALNGCLTEMKCDKHITVHGFRTAFGDWSVDHGFDERDSEMALGHTIGNSVRNIYKRNAQRIEPRRLIMESWAEYCNRPEPMPADVIPFRSAK
jgi:integrase